MSHKKIQIILALLLGLSPCLFAQVPESFSIQAVIRQSNGELLRHHQVGAQVSIIHSGYEDSLAGLTTEYPTTNDYGLITLEIDCMGVDWSEGDYYIEIAIDPNGGQDYSLRSRQHMISVPYALNSISTDSIRGFHWEEKQVIWISHDTIFLTGGSWVKLPPAFDGNFNSLTGRPTNISAFANDAGYLTTEVQVITIAGRRLSLTGGSWVDIPYGFSGNYNDLTNKPTIPTNISQLTNDAGFLTGESQILTISNDTIFLTGGSFVKLPPYIERQGLGDATLLGNSAGNRQLKDLEDPTDPKDAITYKYMLDQLLAWDMDTSHRGNTYTVNTCDQYLWNGEYLTQSGTYTHSYSNGDNRFVDDTLILTIRHSSHQTINITQTENYIWHGTTYTTSGTYTYRYINTDGCPSTDTLSLRIVSGTDCATYRETWDTSYMYSCGSTYWYDQRIITTGQYEKDLGPIAYNGCDSIVRVYVEILEVPRSDTSIRASGPVVWRGHTYSTPGDYRDTVSSSTGCDSIFSLHLMPTGDLGIGATRGVFSVSPTQQVKFSQGNLQYQSSSNRWRFAEHQYDATGSTCLGSYYPTWADLFGWATSGYHNAADTLNTNFMPWDRNSEAAAPGTSAYTNNLYGFGPSLFMTDTNLIGTSHNYDWGTYNSIMNGGNGATLWRTLTYDEWNYLLNGRPQASQLVGYGYIYGNPDTNTNNYIYIQGIILLSDDWSCPPNIYFSSLSNGGYGNSIEVHDWRRMEEAGAIFLPYTNGDHGIYWSSTSGGAGGAYGFSFTSQDTAIAPFNRSMEYGVRLVQDYTPGVAECSCTYFDTNIVSANPITWNGSSYSQSGDYFNITDNSQGCDSIITFSFILTESGELPGAFSISDSSQIHFSKGNLHYKPSANLFRFANQQYEYFGDQNRFMSPTYAGWIDLFHWATSGYHDSTDALNTGYQPYHTEGTFGPSVNMSDWNIVNTSAKYDWGVFNAIPNGGNTAGAWRTLTNEEWNYLIYQRSSDLYLYANVCGVNGMILLPDSWTDIPSIPFNRSYTWSYDDYANNTFDSVTWHNLELAGAVFLPAAGFCGWNGCYSYFGEAASYWSSTKRTEGSLNEFTDDVYVLRFGFHDEWWEGVNPSNYMNSGGIASVRLVKDISH